MSLNDSQDRFAGCQLTEKKMLQLVCAVELPYTVVSVKLLDKSQEDLPGNKIGDLSKEILAFIHNQRVLAHKISNSFQIKVIK